MKKCIVILFVSIVIVKCCPERYKDNSYYFYNVNGLFDRYEYSNDTMAYVYYEIKKKIPPSDSFSIEGGFKNYGLIHYYHFSNHRDTSFEKPKSYLDSIDYYGNDWFKKEENLDKFWNSYIGWFDTLKIYVIEPVEGTDSLICRRVNRFFCTIDG